MTLLLSMFSWMKMKNFPCCVWEAQQRVVYHECRKVHFLIIGFFNRAAGCSCAFLLTFGRNEVLKLKSQGGVPVSLSHSMRVESPVRNVFLVGMPVTRWGMLLCPPEEQGCAGIRGRLPGAAGEELELGGCEGPGRSASCCYSYRGLCWWCVRVQSSRGSQGTEKWFGVWLISCRVGLSDCLPIKSSVDGLTTCIAHL